MRIVLLALVAACEIQPPPKQQPAQTSPTTVAAAKPLEAVPADAAPPPPAPADAFEIPNDCENVGSHVAQVVIESTKDRVLKAEYERTRTKIVLAMAEACTTQHWSAGAKQCYLDSKLEADVRACEKKFPPPGAVAPVAPAHPA